MGMSFGRAQAVEAERRSYEREELSCPARLKTSYSFWQGALTDISVAGARFEGENPPKEGATALVTWDSHEVLCQVIWSKDGACGLRFERQIAELAVYQAVTRHERPERQEPPATLGNIPLGRSRRAGGIVRSIR